MHIRGSQNRLVGVGAGSRNVIVLRKHILSRHAEGGEQQNPQCPQESSHSRSLKHFSAIAVNVHAVSPWARQEPW
jgi:hypothetical protein